MMTLEGIRILTALRQRGAATVADLARCWRGAAVEFLGRVLSELEWFGCVVVYRDRVGRPVRVQITAAGVDQLDGPGRAAAQTALV
jgi:hypothetical protein